MFSRRSLLVILAVSGILSLSACTMWEQKPPPAWANASGAEQFERLLWQEIKAKNWTEVEHHLGPTFVEVTSTGVRDRAQTLERLKALDLTDYSLGEVEVRPNGADMVATYSITLRAASGGETSLRMMTVWQQVKGGWVAIAHSESNSASQ